MFRILLRILAGGLLLFLCMVPHTHVHVAGKEDRMKERIEDYLAGEERLQGAVAAIHIADAETGKTLYEQHADVRMRPASNMKLLTAAAVLHELGPSHQFKTKVATDGHVKDGKVEGNLYLVGQGDPSLTYKDLQQLTIQLKNLGIHHISGDIMADDSWFDQERYSEDTTWKDESAYYGAAISALTVSPDEDHDTGTVKVEVRADTSSQVPAIRTTPATDYITVRNDAVIVGEQEETDLDIVRSHGKNEIVISGSIAKGDKEQERVAVWEPTEYALHLFADYVSDAGINWEGTVKKGTAPSRSQTLLKKESAPLQELLLPFMKLSNNGHAEMFIKQIGRKEKPGNWADGIDQMKHYLKQRQLPVEQMIIRDGAGLSHANGITAKQLTTLLTKAQKESWFPYFRRSLPIAGEPERMLGGTLRNRFADSELAGNVTAKTGTLTGVSSLSGYMKIKTGEQIVFSIVLNGLLDEEDGPVIEDYLLKLVYDNLDSMHNN
ncbi:D-alanyl-D-alanine carboxypeptidase/D-alanyl-D-alanine-endopeptidase [Terribacillus sp. DMT04]|uniref:D-alanyl-D-alanine carboxypeptidase/D-alanyl-D-alanine endopeptidase n=1 Tax=Terribacillus sp. DMT04 TaxID=2850441 RepID=UPI001C2CC0A5|nr:D-alanyl-D-alanine carboxypeptidase/D-alanyl-D-alanine-endopeptidase [Terribacillus sp. DMT04]QXE03281.1 D-alanyl-D-alanine carboxypeptidase/D-alanyl-D-alanine-endopeptidase [Terribacillus sp. DMT04]